MDKSEIENKFESSGMRVKKKDSGWTFPQVPPNGSNNDAGKLERRLRFKIAYDEARNRNWSDVSIGATMGYAVISAFLERLETEKPGQFLPSAQYLRKLEIALRDNSPTPEPSKLDRIGKGNRVQKRTQKRLANQTPVPEFKSPPKPNPGPVTKTDESKTFIPAEETLDFHIARALNYGKKFGESVDYIVSRLGGWVTPELKEVATYIRTALELWESVNGESND